MKTITVMVFLVWVPAVIRLSAASTPERASSSAQAAFVIDTSAPTEAYSRMIFGGFLEHFDNQVYGGVFEPGSPLADGQGFRLALITALKPVFDSGTGV